MIEQLPPQVPEAFLGGLRSLFHFGLSEVFRLEDLADFDIRRAGHRVRAALDPFNRLIDRFYVPDPIPGNQVLRIREWPHGDGAILSGKCDARALRTCLETIGG